MDNKDACAITYFGDGATSEVDEKYPVTGQLISSALLPTVPDRWKYSGRLPCGTQLRSCYGSTGDLLLPQQWLGNQHSNLRTIQKYVGQYLVSEMSCDFYKLISPVPCWSSSVLTGDGVVVRGQAYGIRAIRVDGNDALAVYSAVHAAREMAITEGRPILVEVHNGSARLHQLKQQNFRI
jgi:hypothetical protein